MSGDTPKASFSTFLITSCKNTQERRLRTALESSKNDGEAHWKRGSILRGD